MDEMQMKDEFFGDKGIDTPYERELIDPEVNIEFPEKTSEYQILPDTLNMIERSREFRLSKALMNYQELYDEIQALLSKIEERNSNDSAFKEFVQALQTSSKNIYELLEIENQHSGHTDSGDFELYGMLFRMGKSISVRMTFLDQYFRTQLTDKTNIDEIEQAELDSISEWEKKENEIAAIYLELSDEIDEAAETEINKLEEEKRVYERLHTTLADISFIHQNRYLMFSEVVQQAKILVEHPTSLIDGDMRYFLKQLSMLPDLSTAKIHLLLLFRQYKEKLQSLKGKYAFIDDMKETFLSEKHYLFQRITRNATDPIRKWLYDQIESASRTLDIFASLMVNAIKRSKEQYEDSMMDLLKFYRKEAVFYYEQIAYLQKKEQIRLFLRIIEDLQETSEITDEWIEEYVKANGYEEGATS
jgi:hypothetical protein